MHETKRNPTRIRTAAATCHRVAEEGAWYPRGSSPNRRRGWLGGSLAGCLQARWSKGTEKQATTPSALQALGQAASQVDRSAEKRSGRSWLSYSFVDPGACGRGNLSTLRGAISSLWSLAHLKWAGLELSKTRAACPRTQREGHREMASSGLAPDKKKREEQGVASFCWTKPALCFNRWCGGLGRHGARPRYGPLAGLV